MNDSSTKPNLTQRVCVKLVDWRIPLLMIAIGLAAIAVAPARNVKFDRSIENMFAADDPLLPPYQKLKNTFGGNEVVLAVYEDHNLLDSTGGGLKRLQRVTERLKKVEGVADVLSLSTLNDTLSVVNFLSKSPPLINPNNRLAQRYLKIFEGYTHNAERNVAAIACMLQVDSTSADSRRETVLALRDIMESPEGSRPAGMITGEPVMVVDGFLYVEQDGKRLGWSSTVLLALTIIACFRSLRWVLIPIAVVQMSMLLTRAILVWSGIRLSMVSSMLTAIVTVVGVATVVHIIVRYREQRQMGLSPRESLLQSSIMLITPIFWACTTDAIGFASLTIASVGPVHDFGIMMAVGAMSVFISVWLLLPGLALLGKWDVDPKTMWGEKTLERTLNAIVRRIQSHPTQLGVAITITASIVATGVLRLDVETDFTKNFRQASPIVQSYQFVEERLGGAGVWDVIIPAPRRLTDEYVDRISKLQSSLRDLTLPNGEPSLTKVISLIDAVEAADLKALIGVEMRAAAMSASMPTFVAALRNSKPAEDGRYYLRIMLRARERQSAEEKQFTIDHVTSLVKSSFPEKDRDRCETTGFFVLLTNLIKSMIRDQWTCFAAATIGIALTMWLAFRSLRMSLIALVPNAMPILVVLGGMGWLGLKINMGAAMIAAVSMGLSIDSSIHYVTSYRRSRASGVPAAESLTNVQQMVGRAMVYATLALIVGFSALCGSQFVPTIYFGALVSLAMIGGLLGNLIVLPLLLQSTEPAEPA